MKGHLKFILYASLVLVGLAILVSLIRGPTPPGAANAPTAPPPSRTPAWSPKVGSRAILDAPGEDGVWLARESADLADLVESQRRIAERAGAGAGGLRARLAEAGRIRPHASGAEVDVLEVDDLGIRVRFLNGEDSGRVGWAPVGNVRPPRAPEAAKGKRPQAPPAKAAATLLRMGLDLEKAGNAKGAREYYDRIGREYPDSAEAKGLKAKD